MTATNALRGRTTNRRMRQVTFAAGTMRRPRRAYDEEYLPEERLARGLGWFSIGLGLSELLATRGFARFIGVRDDFKNRALLRMVGLRELACGVGILTRRRPPGWVWARVAGDAMDITLLSSALAGARRGGTGSRRPPPPSSA